MNFINDTRFAGSVNETLVVPRIRPETTETNFPFSEILLKHRNLITITVTQRVTGAFRVLGAQLMAQHDMRTHNVSAARPKTGQGPDARAAATDDAYLAANNAYRQLLEIGNTQQSALVLATIAYLQRNPMVPMMEARARVAAMVGAIG